MTLSQEVKVENIPNQGNQENFEEGRDFVWKSFKSNKHWGSQVFLREVQGSIQIFEERSRPHCIAQICNIFLIFVFCMYRNKDNFFIEWDVIFFSS